MIESVLQVARVVIGAKIFYDVCNDTLNPPLEGIEYPDKQYQEYTDQISRISGIAEKVLVRQSPSFKGKPMVFSKGNRFLGHLQICIPQETPLSPSILKFASIHELGHLSNHHSLIIGAIIATNVALFAMPFIPIKVVCSTFAMSALSFIPLYRWMERQADDFAFDHCSKEILKEAFQNDGSHRKQDSWLGALFAKYVAVGNEEKRKLARSMK